MSSTHKEPLETDLTERKGTTSTAKSRPKGHTPTKPSRVKVALVMDWLTTVGGAERVLKSVHELYPDAPIYTSQYRKKGIDWFKDADVRTGWLNIFPAKMRRLLGPLRQIYFSHLDLSEYDIIISVTGAEAKAVKTVGKHGRATHFCYCHVPTQYYWGFYDQYIENPGFGVFNPIIRTVFKCVVKPLRKADFKSAQRPDYFISISNYAAEEITKYYGREVKVIYPPVSTALFRNPVENSTTKKGIVKPQKPEQEKGVCNTARNTSFVGVCAAHGECPLGRIHAQAPLAHDDGPSGRAPTKDGISRPYYINFSRQVSWKRLDLAIKACLKTKQHLVLIGDGPEHNSLVKLAGGSKYITFLPQMSQPELKAHLNGAKAFIFPSKEPFGIAPIEALAAGCPVIAYGDGGALDYIEDGKNGLLFDRQSTNSLVKAIETFEDLLLNPQNGKQAFPVKAVQASADRFSEANFKKELRNYIDERISKKA